MSLIYVDWGSTRRRGFLFSPAGNLQDQRSDEGGVKNVPRDQAEASLVAFLKDWLGSEPQPRLLISGMVTSREGWFPSPSLPLPMDLAKLGQALYRQDSGQTFGEVLLIPGLQGKTADGASEFMRGEETQIYLAMRHTQNGDACMVLPGTHSKWVSLERRRVAEFRTFLTGELFAVLTTYSLLNVSGEAPFSISAFDQGVGESLRATGGPGEILHLLFRGRAKVLDQTLAPEALASWLSGLLIGSEVKQGLRWFQSGDKRPLVLLGDGHLTFCYQRVFAQMGTDVMPLPAADLVTHVFDLAKEANL